MPDPRRLLWLAFFMLLAGAVLPFAMVIGLLPPALLLSVLSYASSVGGLFLGIIALASLYQVEQRRDRMDGA